MQIVINSLEELKELAEALLEKQEEKTAPIPEKSAPVPEKTEPVPEKTAPEKAYTITEVRAFLGNLRKAGKKDEVTKLIADLGYEKFTEVPEGRYAELMEKARAL